MNDDRFLEALVPIVFVCCLYLAILAIVQCIGLHEWVVLAMVIVLVIGRVVDEAQRW